MSETPQAGPTYSVKDVAKLLNLSPRRVQQLAKEGIIPKTEGGRYELAPAVQGYIGYLHDRLSGKVEGDEDDTMSLQSQRTRKVAAEAAQAEIALAKSRGEVVERAIIMNVVERGLAACRARLLIGASVAPHVKAAPDAATVKELIDDRVTEALDEISSNALGFASGSGGAKRRGSGGRARSNDGAAHQDDGERVG